MSNTKRDVIFFTGVSLICCFTSTATAASWPVHGQNDSSISLRADDAIAPFSIDFDDFHFRGKRSPLRPLVQKVAASNKIKQVLKWGAGKIFPGFIGNFIKVMLDLFWPTDEPSVWDEAKDNFRQMLDRETFETVQALLIAKTQAFHLKLRQLARELEENQVGVSAHYMALAWDLVGLEAEFVIPDAHHSAKTLNRDLLQLYSNIVLMKATYYSLGVRCRARIGLTEEDAWNVKNYFGAVVHGANQHVNKTFKDLRSYADDEKYAETVYLRNQMRDHGYIAIWQNMLVNEGRRVALDELRFSSNFGRYDSADGDRIVNLATRILTPPRPIGSQYGQLRRLTVYHRSGGAYYDRQPVGFRMVFAPADETRSVGYKSGANDTFEVGPTIRLTKIVGYSWGGGRVHGLKLTFTDVEGHARTYRFGCESAKDERQRLFLFEKPGYYIAAVYAGLYETIDVKGLRTMSVSYLPMRSEAAGDADDDRMVDWKCDDSKTKAQLRRKLRNGTTKKYSTTWGYGD